MIDINDLRHSISTALNLGRYTILVRQIGGEPVPASITLDLVERDDDGFLTEADLQSARAFRRSVEPAFCPAITPDGEELVDTVTDEHGPAIPAQGAAVLAMVDPGVDSSFPPGEPRVVDLVVYEFALDDSSQFPHKGLGHITFYMVVDARPASSDS